MPIRPDIKKVFQEMPISKNIYVSYLYWSD